MINTPDVYRTVTTAAGSYIETHPECQWVIDGHGRPGPWRDGKTVRIDDDGIWIERANGWTKLAKASAAVKKAFNTAHKNLRIDPDGGLYELCGPGINRNRHQLDTPVLYAHNGDLYGSEHEDFDVPAFPRNYNALAKWLRSHNYLGIVWYHRDDPTRTAKLLTANIK